MPAETSSSSNNQVRPNAIVCEIDQLSWGKSLGFGEVKLAETTPNLDELGNDLLRLATLSKNALSNSGLHAAMSFQIHGNLFMIYRSRILFIIFHDRLSYENIHVKTFSWNRYNSNVRGIVLGTSKKCSSTRCLYYSKKL